MAKLGIMVAPFCRVVLQALIVMALLAVSLGAQREPVTDIGALVREGEDAVVPVAVRSSDEETLAVMQACFVRHGAVALVSEQERVFFVRVEPTGENAVALEVGSGRPEQVQFARTVEGADRYRATLKAADLAIGRLTGTPGFSALEWVFVSDRSGHREIYEADFLFRRVRQITRDGAPAMQPTLSPDGQTLLYTGYFRSGFPDIFRIDRTTGERTLFAAFRGSNLGAAWSPDGRSVAMILSGSGNAELYRANAQGRELQRLTRTSALEADPAWSPDGRQLVYASDAPGRPQLYLMGADGSAPRRLPTDISGYCAEPDWNPRDPDVIAFTIAQAGAFEVALYRFSQRRSEVVTRGEGDAMEPRWLPDGRHLVYTERIGPRRRGVILDTVTGSTAYVHGEEFGNSGQLVWARVP